MTAARVGVRGLRGVAELTGLHDVRAAAKDWQTFSSRLQGDPDVRTYPQLPLEVDPPAHGAYRAILEPILGRRAIVALEPAIRGIATTLVDAFRRGGRGDGVTNLALPMVGRTIAVAFGRPEDADELTSWGITSWEVFEDGSRSGARLDAYVDRALDDRGGDAFGAIVRATIDGRALTRAEQVGLANLILAGGRDTVIHVLAGAMWHLAGEASARATLRAEPQRLQLAVEEYLRYFSPNPGMERVLTTSAAGEWGSGDAGDFVVLGWGPANHDALAFDEPGEIRLDRRPNPHLAFGSGVHTCIGIHLARLEIRVFLEELLRATPDWRLEAPAAFETLQLGRDVVPSRFERLPLVVG